MDQITLDKSKKLLEEEHDRLVGELKSIATKDKKMADDWDAKFPKFDPAATGSYGASGKLEEEADEVEEYEVRLAAEHSLESRLLEVNRALERIQNGTYGNCLVCKKELPIERLRANPAAETHIEHT